MTYIDCWATQMANSSEPNRYNTEEAILKRGGYDGDYKENESKKREKNNGTRNRRKKSDKRRNR